MDIIDGHHSCTMLCKWLKPLEVMLVYLKKKCKVFVASFLSLNDNIATIITMQT